MADFPRIACTVTRDVIDGLEVDSRALRIGLVRASFVEKRLSIRRAIAGQFGQTDVIFRHHAFSLKRGAREPPRHQIIQSLLDRCLCALKAAATPFDAAIGVSEAAVGVKLHSALIAFLQRDFVARL
jgi:hypothetical protein